MEDFSIVENSIPIKKKQVNWEFDPKLLSHLGLRHHIAQVMIFLILVFEISYFVVVVFFFFNLIIFMSHVVNLNNICGWFFLTATSLNELPILFSN